MYTFSDKELQEDAWQERSLPHVWSVVDTAWILNPSYHAGLFSSFDSRFFGSKYKEEQCVYCPTREHRFPMLGREANYYFQGLIFRAFKQPKSKLKSFMFWWKQSYYAQGLVLKEGQGLYVPSTNDYFMALLGYDDHPWYLARRGASDDVKMGPITRIRGFGSYWLEASRIAAEDHHYTTAH